MSIGLDRQRAAGIAATFESADPDNRLAVIAHEKCVEMFGHADRRQVRPGKECVNIGKIV